MNRRDVLTGGAAMVLLAGRTDVALGQQAKVEKALQAATGGFAGGSKVVALGKVPVERNPNGSERQDVIKGELATGEAVSVHASGQQAGTQPLLHTITHSELIVVMEGELEFAHDGKLERAAAGDVIYVAYGTKHSVRNVAEGVTRYVVVQVGA